MYDPNQTPDAPFIRRYLYICLSKGALKVTRSPVADVFDGVVDQLFDLAVVFNLLLYLLQRINDGGVMSAAEFLADIDHGQRRDLSGARVADVGALVLLRADLVSRNAEGARYLVNDALDRDLRRHIVVQNVGNYLLRRRDGDLFVIEKILRLELFDRALELADIGFELGGDELADLVGEVDVEQLRLALDDGDARFDVGRLDVGDQILLKARAQTVGKGLDLLGRTVGGQHDLLVGVIERVEGVEEFLLHRLLAAEKLHVVHQQHIDLTVLLTELDHGFHLERLDHLVDKIVDLDVADGLVGIILFDLVLNGKEQMGLAQARIAVKKQRIVGVGGIGGDRHACRVRKVVGGTDDKGIKGVFVVIDRFFDRLWLRRRRLVDLVGRFERDFELVVEDSLKRLVQQRNIAARDRLAVKVVGNDQIGSVRVKIQLQRLDTDDPGIVCDVGDFCFAVGAHQLPRVAKHASPKEFIYFLPLIRSNRVIRRFPHFSLQKPVWYRAAVVRCAQVPTIHSYTILL